MSKAQEFLNSNPGNINTLMTALDASSTHSEQDYSQETTTWYFDDGSFIKIQNEDIETGVNE